MTEEKTSEMECKVCLSLLSLSSAWKVSLEQIPIRLSFEQFVQPVIMLITSSESCAT